jgi:adenine deaminase
MVGWCSDDPAYFGGYVNSNYLGVAQALGLTPERILQLVQNSFQAAFISEEDRKAYLQRVQQVYDEVMRGAA